MEFRFGDDWNKYAKINSKTLENAIKIFKVKELWPEQYVAESFKKDRETFKNDAGINIPQELPDTAYVPVFIFDQEKSDALYEEWEKKRKKKGPRPNWNEADPAYKLPLIQCIDVNYNDITDTKYLPLPAEEENSVIISSEETELMGAVNSKLKAREMQNRIGRTKKELEKRMEIIENELEKQRELLEEEIDKFNGIIQNKIKTLYAIETYLGVYEEITRLASGKPASPDEPITVYQQKCYMDEEVGLTEVSGYKFSQGLDFKDIREFDKWIAKRYKRYLYKEKSIMAWQVRRKEKDYGDRFENAINNPYNFETYYLLRNGGNVYRIFSGVGTHDTLFPTKEKMDEVFNEDKRRGEGEKTKDLYERYMYVFIMLQGLVDRTDVFGTNFAGKIDFINPLRFDKSYVVLVRDAEPDNWIPDGRPTWESYKKLNETTITVGSRVLVNHIFDVYGENPKGDINGEVRLVEEYKPNNSKANYKEIIAVIPKIMEMIEKYDKKMEGNEKEFERKLKKLHNDIYVDKSFHCNEIICNRHIIAKVDMTKKIYWKDFLPILKESLEEYKELMNDCENDKYKIYYLPHEVIYNGWGDYYGHERKNRKAYWAKGYELMNIDTITYEELRYYLNNRLYRKDYLEMIPFLKRIYLYKKEEYDKETPFVKLLMKKTGIDDEKRVREALTWWKIKNKWKRWLETDDAKAYRMLCRKLCGGGEV